MEKIFGLKNRKWIFFQGIFFISLSSLVLEITLTRIFTVSFGSNYAYLVISMALLGYGAAGTFLKVFPRILEINTNRLFIGCSLLFSMSVLISYLIVNSISFDPAEILWNNTQIGYLFLIFLILSFPFFFSGLIVISSMYFLSNEIGKVYFFDLFGAGFGCFAPLLFFSFLKGEHVVLTVVITGLISSFLFSLSFKTKWRYICPFIVIFVLSVFFIQPKIMEIRISPYRDLMMAMRYEDSTLIDSRWNAVSKIEIFDSPAVRFAPGISIRYMESLPDQTGIAVDGGSLQAITVFGNDQMDFIEHLPSSLSYVLNTPERVFVYDFGGGLDIISALYYEAKIIDATERNPGVADYLTSFYEDVSGFEIVNIHKGDGRNFLKTTEEKYDLIILSLTDTLGASAGIFSSGEDYRFTVEAFSQYYEKIAEGGYISVTRYLKPVPSEEGKLIATVIESLNKYAVPQKNIIVIRSIGTITILIKNGEVLANDIEIIKMFCSENGFDLVYYPDISVKEANIYNRFSEPIYFNMFNILLNDDLREEFIENYIFNIEPATDNAPYFYNYFSLNRIIPILKTVSEKWDMIVQGGYTVHLVVVQSFILSVFLILLPVIIKRRRDKTIIGRSAKTYALLYFILIAAAFMFVEITMIYKMVLLFGNPVYSLTIVLFSILTSSGIGSLFAEKMIKNKKRGILIITPLLAGVLIIYAFLMPVFIDILMGMPLIWRIVFGSGILFPVGFLMGMPFPLGMGLIGRANKGLIPWVWCANGCSSVVCASLSMVVAASTGFVFVICFAGIMYILSAISMYFFSYRIASPVIGTNETVVI